MILFQATPDHRHMLLHFIDVMNSSVANVSMHASVPKEDILAFNFKRLKSTQQPRVKFIWLILSTIRQNGDTL